MVMKSDNYIILKQLQIQINTSSNEGKNKLPDCTINFSVPAAYLKTTNY